MRNTIIKMIFILIVLVSFTPLLSAEDSRIIPLDMYLIIDGSESFQNSKNEAVAWINSQVVERILIDGDKLTVWTAGNSYSQVYSGTIAGSGEKREIREKLQALTVSGKTADFSGALRDAASAASRTPQDRLSYTMLITASAEGLEGAITGSSGGLLKWFRSEKYERWQVLIVATEIAPKVREAAASYMSSIR